MRWSLLCDRRAVGRSASARFYGDEATGGRIRAQSSAVLADSSRRHGKSQRCTDALADHECAVSAQYLRRARAWNARMGCRAVSCARIAARPLERRS